jgi:hypothetical protein
VQLGVKDWVTGAELLPQAGGATLPAVMLMAGKLAGTPPPKSDRSLGYRVGDDITLLDASILHGDNGPILALTWATTAVLPEAYTTFVHVLDADGNLIGQADGPPLNGDYPTDWWSPGETIVDARPLPLPPEANRVTIGLYRLSDQARLPIVDGSGLRLPNDEIVLPVQP